ncbi:PREDICTED: uncharacterized serine-rich protein C215.13-like [Lupinus angustifolius]|uniref:uncharacterized serine-rich protein C215.13-like n=1 Tax=Lupinus angustifolius TaxID=3871 RepID=UPI00092EE457|nr:PREDICTED: uncharacterized serine-rich protein C215.13-like [Lupinus angustifolius]
MEMCRWEEHNGNGYHHPHHLKMSIYDGNIVPNGDSTIIMSSSFSSSSSSSSSSPPSAYGYIEHTISKLDTLAGIAIKYGLEVADIKKMNSLITDHQMFALKTLRIPLSGRHSPPRSSNGSNDSSGHGNSDHNLHDDTCRELLESFLSQKMKSSGQKLSTVTSSGCYETKPTMKKSMSVFEMAMCRKGASNSSEYGSHLPMSTKTSGHHKKSTTLASEIFKSILESSDVVEAKEDDESNEWNDTPEKLLAPQNNNTSSGRFSSSRTAKSLALRQKSGSRTILTTDSESSSINPLLIRLGSAFGFDGQSSVRKSISTSCLQEQYNSGNSSIWPAFSATGIAKPRTGRRNKAALD